MMRINFQLINFSILAGIALMLAILLYLDYVLPYQATIRYENQFKTYHKNCIQALTSETVFLDLSLQLDIESRRHLNNSLEIEKLVCEERDIIKAKMLSARVKPENIELMEKTAQFGSI